MQSTEKKKHPPNHVAAAKIIVAILRRMEQKEREARNAQRISSIRQAKEGA